MSKTIRTILVAVVLVMCFNSSVCAGNKTTYGYFYKPSYGEKGPASYSLYNAALDATDTFLHATFAIPQTLYNLINTWAIEDNILTMITATPAYSDNNTFTLTGDYTSRFTAGKVVQAQVAAGMVYSTVASSSYAAPTTTVNLNDTVLTDPITRVYVVATRDGLWPNGPGYVVAADYGSTQAALVAADAVAAAAEKQLLIGRTYSITSDLVLAASVKVMPGAVLSIATTKTLTINGSLEAGPYQIFSCTGTGKVVFGAGAVKDVYPEWWAVNTAPGTTDMTAGVQAAFTAGVGSSLYLSQTYSIGAVTIPGAITVRGPGKLLGPGSLTATGTLEAGVPYGSTIAIGESSFTVANSFAVGEVLQLSNYPVTAADRRKELLIVATATEAGFTTTTAVLQTYGSTTSLQFQKMIPIKDIYLDAPNLELVTVAFDKCQSFAINKGRVKSGVVQTLTCLKFALDFADYDAQNTGCFVSPQEMSRDFTITGNFTGGVAVSDNGIIKTNGAAYYSIDANITGSRHDTGYFHGFMADTLYSENPTGYVNQANCYFSARINARGVDGNAVFISSYSTPTDVYPHDFYVDGQWNVASIQVQYANNGIIAGNGYGGVLQINHTDGMVVTNDNYASYNIFDNTNLQGIWQSFTPTVSGSTGSAPEPALNTGGSNCKGRYIKRGHTITFDATYTWTDAGSRTGNLILNTPPYDRNNDTALGYPYNALAISYYIGLTNTNGLSASIGAYSQVISLHYDGGTPVPLSAAGTITLSGSYETWY